LIHVEGIGLGRTVKIKTGECNGFDIFEICSLEMNLFMGYILHNSPCDPVVIAAKNHFSLVVDKKSCAGKACKKANKTQYKQKVFSTFLKLRQ